MPHSLLDRVLATLPSAYPGPGGAAAVIQKGEIIARHSWGFANAETRTPFTPQTLFRMCSITKQFTCALLDAVTDKARLDAVIASRLPLLQEPPPDIFHLAHNQSGLRDYWAVAMLHGAPTESVFGLAEARRVIAGTRSLHFRPGTSYSYVNQNFHLISEALEACTGRSFAELLRTRIFERYGMKSAFLAANTQSMPDGTQGYEGSEATGYRQAVNNIFWTGDAGLGASLDDMIAWECAIDAQRDDPQGFYNRLSAPVTFGDGTPARYGFGLQRGRLFGHAMTGHGGALRGWRSHRLHLAQERLSVVVMLNHMSEAHSAAAELAGAALGIPPSLPARAPGNPAMLGHYLDAQTGLSATITSSDQHGGSGNNLALRYAYPPERLDNWTQSGAGRDGTTLTFQDDRHPECGLIMNRPQENTQRILSRLAMTQSHQDLAGRYLCEELDSILTLSDTGGALYGAFSGMLGQGRMERLLPLGDDVWLIPCLRALDHSPPGYWTLSFQRDAAQALRGIRVGCWLARDLFYHAMTD
ncbi:D-aminopeptidase [Asaia bogorensis]|uniref:D-aminopeptidase n=1 Tax=Asaia bogorensis TaxID=91915 RepID=UPI000EFD3202|nr:D-aminopeptidase [Asaia bogorensis]